MDSDQKYKNETAPGALGETGLVQQQTPATEAAMMSALDSETPKPMLIDGAQAFSREINKRKYVFHALKRAHGFFLTRLDVDGKILAFLAGAMRTQIDEHTDEVAIVTPQDIVRGIDGSPSFIPVPKVITLQGAERDKLYRVAFHPSDYFEWMVQQSITEGAAWGVIYVHPANSRHRLGGTYQGDNHEEYLDPRSWKILTDVNGRIYKNPAGGGGNLQARLAPSALQIVDDPKKGRVARGVVAEFPTCWSFATEMLRWFGGMTNPPIVPGMKDDAQVFRIVQREDQLRARFELEAEIKKARQRASRRNAIRPSSDIHTVGANIDGASSAALWAMENEILAKSDAGAGETSTGAD